MAPNRFPRSNDTPMTEAFLGQVGGAANVWQPADASITRPNNATAYSQFGIVGSATAGLFTFSKFFRVKGSPGTTGSTGLLTGARLVASVGSIATSNMGTIVGHLYNVAPNGGGTLTDQTAFQTLAQDDAAKLGTITWTTWTIGGTGSNLIESYGALAATPLPIISAINDNSLYLVLMANAAFTPIANAVITPYLSAVLD